MKSQKGGHEVRMGCVWGIFKNKDKALKKTHLLEKQRSKYKYKTDSLNSKWRLFLCIDIWLAKFNDK